MTIRQFLASAVIGATLAPALPAQKDNKPRVSATDTSYLSCTFWDGHKWTDKTARSARTQMAESPKGFRAYGEVNVALSQEFCQNTTTLHVASGAGQAFRVAYTKADSEGSGIHLIGWSPSGEKLLAEVNTWEYETDRGFDHIALIYDASTGSAKEVPAVSRAVSRHFGPGCEFELAIVGWKTDVRILVKVSRPPKTESYEQHFCVNRALTFVFDVSRDALQLEPQESAEPK
jgi:hypothetical protein